MSMPRSSARRRKHRRGEGALGDGAAVGHQLGGGAALADRLAEREIARAGRGAGQHQVAEARQAGQRFPPRAHGEAEAGHFGKAARDQRGARILAEALALDHAAGDRQHVLDRAADLGAGDVVAQIDAEAGQGDALAERFAERRDPRRPASPRSAGRRRLHGRRSGPTAPRPAQSGRPRARRRGAACRCASSMPFEQRISGLPAGRRGSSTARICCAGVTTSQASQLVELGEIAGRADRRDRAAGPGRIDRILVDAR